MPYYDIGRRIRARRKEMGKTQQQLCAEMLDDGYRFSQPLLSQVENGRCRVVDISTNRLVGLSRALKCTIPDLLGVTE